MKNNSVDQSQPLPVPTSEPATGAVDLVAGLETYQRRLYDECVTAKWDPEQCNTFAEEVAHLHEEVSEAFRAWRLYKDFDVHIGVNGKPEGVPIELADTLIGLFYNAELHGFDLFAAVEQKHQFNLTRNYINEGRQLHSDDAAKTDQSTTQATESSEASKHSDDGAENSVQPLPETATGGCEFCGSWVYLHHGKYRCGHECPEFVTKYGSYEQTDAESSSSPIAKDGEVARERGDTK